MRSLPCRLPSLALALVLGPGAFAQEHLPRFVQFPDVRGDKVVFTYEGDLWTAAVQGGTAQRLTTHPGNELAAHFSPDGKWIAFSGQYDGAQSVYLMPAEGGTPKRLTWRGNSLVLGWTPDGKKILFRAALDFDFRPVTRIYAVDLEGHEPEALPLPKGTQASLSPDGTRLLYNPKGNEEYYWKRYKGGQYPEIWLADLKAKTYQRVTDYVGKNAYPMWTAEGKALFVSDRGPGGVSNLYALDLATKGATALTDFKDFDVQWPSTDGKRVVFVKGGYLHVLDLTTRETKRIELRAPSDGWRYAPRAVNPKEWIQTANLAAGGKTLALEARGDVFLLPVDATQSPVNLTQTPGTRERYPQISPDGQQVAYFSDESGDYDLYVRPATGGPATRLATGLSTTFYHLDWSPDGKKLLFADKSFALYVMDVATKKLTKVDESHELKNDEFTWEVSDYAWAPDSTWITYSFVQPNHNSRIYLYNLSTRQKIALTDGFFDALNPRFDADGSTLYFLSYSNFQVMLDPSQDNHIQSSPVQVMAVKLRADEAPKASSKSEPFRIDTEGLAERVSVLPVKAGNLFHLKAGKGLVGWSSVEGWDESANEEVFNPKGQPRWVMHFFDPASKKETVVPEPVSEWSFDPSGTSLVVRKAGNLHVGAVQAVMTTKALPERVDLERLSMTVVPREEWKQIFEDCWRWYRDFFYDAHFHGQDWKAIHDKYAAWLPDLTSRSELNWLLSQMVGELCVSHTYVGGGDMGPAASPALRYTGLLGADLAPGANGFYTFSKVYGPTPYAPDLKAPLSDPATRVKPGEFLLAIDGQPVKAPEALYPHLQVIRGQKVKLTVNAKATLEGARVIEVEPLASEWNLRYERWVADNVAKVEKLSNGELGYLHLTAMGDQNIGQFDKFWQAFRNRKGLVVDVRGNGGGWTEYFVIDKLERKQVGVDVLRGMATFAAPVNASEGRYVFLSNEANGSDGEAFMCHVKALKLGTSVGVPSWGGLVGILNTQHTLDGGTVEQSNNAFFGREGQWWIENHGADPDILVENDPESTLAGHDRQLEVGVETLLKQLKENPTPAFPAVPAYPKK